MSPEDPPLLGKCPRGIEARLPRRYRARGHYTSNDKVQIKELTVNQ